MANISRTLPGQQQRQVMALSALQVPRQQSAGLGSLGQQRVQLHRLRCRVASRAVRGSRGRVVCPRAQSASLATRPSEQSDQESATDSEDSPLVQDPHEHVADLAKQDAFARGIWDLQAEIKRHLLQEFSCERVGSQRGGSQPQVFFASKDGLSSFDVEVYESEDSRLRWLATPRTVLVSPFSKSPPDSMAGKFALGGRVNAYVASGHTYAPNLDIELYHWPGFGSLFMYLNLVPRRSLFEYPDDITRFYQDQYEGEAYGELFKACEKHCSDSGWKRFTSGDPFVRAVTGGNSMMYQVPANEANLKEVLRMAGAVYTIWRGLMADGSLPKPASGCERDALAKTDAQLLRWAEHDPDVQRAVPLVGQEGVDRMLALLTGQI